MKFGFLSVVILTAAALSPPALAGDAAAGKKAYMAKGCIGCHGPGGHSPNPDIYPSTAGRDAAYLVERLKAYRSGDLANPMMGPMAAALSDEDIANLAAYLAEQD